MNKWEKNKTAHLNSIYFFLLAFSADLVTKKGLRMLESDNKRTESQTVPFPPEVFSDLSTDLMTPTATVCLMSRTAKRPRGGYSL